jgi:hypothetical protein
VGRKTWLGGAAALLLTAGICLVTPRLAGFALILLALGVVSVFAFRLL